MSVEIVDGEVALEFFGDEFPDFLKGEEKERCPHPSPLPDFSPISMTERRVVVLQKNRGLRMQKQVPLAGGSVAIGIDIEWDHTGARFSGKIEGEVHDDRGNFIEAAVEQDSDGKGRAHIEGGHAEDTQHNC
jgi:hypothetical protein